MATFNVTNSGDSGAGTLREAIELANANSGIDEIFIQTDVQLNSEIKITDSVNIGTPYGATITQLEDARIFNLDDGNTEQKSEVSLYRLNLTGGNAQLGGAITSSENLSITDSFLYDNSAADNGAAVYVLGADLTVERSKFENNQITSIEEEQDLDLYVFNGRLEVINSTLDTIEAPTADEAEMDQAPSELEVEVTEDSESETITAETDMQSDDSFVVGDDSNDTLSGGSGDDTILGGDGANSLEGKAGDDNLLGGNDGDLVSGSDGDDTINGSDGNDSLNGNDGNDIINGGAGVDLIDGGAGDDNLNGGLGSDFIQDSSGSNIIFGNEDSDRLIGGQDTDYLSGGAGDDDIYGGDGNDTLTGESGDDTLDGGAGNDTLLGSDGNDLIRGASGDDIIHGHDGDDYLLGSPGNDILHGDEGNDTLSGDEGDNFLIGGDGSDLFNLIVGGNSVIADFELGTDKLQLSQITYGDLDITGATNSVLDYQGTQIGMVMGISPAELTQDSFIEV
ncbi:MAG: calcium-binding protein [Cyanobacteria bacterium J06600_6]